jgi:hypothetical protein
MVASASARHFGLFRHSRDARVLGYVLEPQRNTSAREGLTGCTQGGGPSSGHTPRPAARMATSGLSTSPLCDSAAKGVRAVSTVDNSDTHARVRAQKRTRQARTRARQCTRTRTRTRTHAHCTHSPHLQCVDVRGVRAPSRVLTDVLELVPEAPAAKYMRPCVRHAKCRRHNERRTVASLDRARAT